MWSPGWAPWLAWLLASGANQTTSHRGVFFLYLPRCDRLSKSKSQPHTHWIDKSGSRNTILLMFCWHSRLRVFSARIRSDKAINFRSSLSISSCWRKLASIYLRLRLLTRSILQLGSRRLVRVFFRTIMYRSKLTQLRKHIQFIRRPRRVFFFYVVIWQPIPTSSPIIPTDISRFSLYHHHRSKSNSVNIN